MITKLEVNQISQDIQNSKDVIGSLNKVWKTMKALSVFVLKVSVYYLMNPNNTSARWWQLSKFFANIKSNFKLLKEVWNLTGEFIQELKFIWGKETINMII